MEEPTFKTTFSAVIKAIEPSEEEILETKASLGDFISNLPEDIRPEDDPDLLYIVANLAVPGLVNLNDDCLMPEDAVAIYKKFEKKQCNIEHNRSDICGYIVKSYLTSFENKILTPEEALASKSPFYITTIAALWKVANKELCNLISESSNPSNPNYNKLSLSFEVGFYSYDIGIAKKDRNAIESLEIISSESEKYKDYDKLLKINGGSGVLNKEEDFVYRILKDNIIPLGQGIVEQPAAQVKGIDIIVKNKEDKEDTEESKDVEDDKNDSEDSDELENDNEEEKDSGEDSMEKEDDDDEKNEKIELSPEQLKTIIINTIKYILSENKIFNKNKKNSVLTINNINIMNKLEELEASWAEVKEKPAQEVFANIRQTLADEISKASEEFVQKQKEAEDKAATLEKEKADAIAAQAEVTSQLEAIKAELQALKDAAASAQKESMYNDHMSLIDQTFDFEDDELALIVAEVRDLDEESFAKWFDKSKKLMKEKTKAYKAEKKQMMEKKLCDAGIKASVDEKTLNFKEIIASAKQVEVEIGNVIEAEESILDKARKAFASE